MPGFFASMEISGVIALVVQEALEVILNWEMSRIHIGRKRQRHIIFNRRGNNRSWRRRPNGLLALS